MQTPANSLDEERLEICLWENTFYVKDYFCRPTLCYYFICYLLFIIYLYLLFTELWKYSTGQKMVFTCSSLTPPKVNRFG